jgi:hypothetical protein
MALPSQVSISANESSPTVPLVVVESLIPGPPTSSLGSRAPPGTL